MIAIVGQACEFADASTPEDLWDNVLARRRAFRRLPPERLALDDYLSTDRGAEDRLYATEAALIEGYEFDRVRFRVPGETYRACDLTHWLALDVACRAIADAGYDNVTGLPRESTGVVLGNTLTGEMSRAATLRLRWPFVRRVVGDALREHGLPAESRRALLSSIEESYKAPFEPVGDETLAGALSNTIAGRICNHLDLGGGGYTVDGACAASLLAIITACQRLDAGELDVAVAGGVDVSLDPFELVGFAKIGALASNEMRVYDSRSQGFWPGEGCGFVVLMREQDARAAKAPVRAVIRGWGISSDGSGGITRPEVGGQLRALRRAYQRADTDIGSVAYFEGHGTGTAVGDPTEMRALAEACGSIVGGRPAVIGSIKANIGHTKAAAGVAGLIKVVSAVSQGVVPPTTGCDDPHPVLQELGDVLRVAETGEPWPAADRVAGVSAFGFGGINSHVVIASEQPVAPRPLHERERLLLASSQDAELFLFSAETSTAARRAVDRLRRRSHQLSRAEMADAAAALAATTGGGRVRAAIVASTPAELTTRLEVLTDLLASGETTRVGAMAGVFVGSAGNRPRIGLLFPGQAAPSHPTGGAMRRRFPFVQDLFAQALATPDDAVDTAFAQPAIVRGSLAATRVLRALAIDADVAVGHSLGEISALTWAGAMDEATALRFAAARGRAMADHGEAGGAMASVALDADGARALADGLPLVVAGLNAAAQTVLSGPVAAIEALVRRAAGRGVAASRLRVSHAFHSPSMAPASAALLAALDGETIGSPVGKVVSTVTGEQIAAEDDVAALLLRQLTEPVRFTDAVQAAFSDVDLVIEAGPGHILTGLVESWLPVAAVATDVGGPSVSGLLAAAGAAWAFGESVDLTPLFGTRFARPIDLDRAPRLFSNPCERAPRIDDGVPSAPRPSAPPPTGALDPEAAATDALGLVRAIVADRTELPLDAVLASSRLLDDLHLSSIVVSEIAVEASRRLGLPPPPAPTALANATVQSLTDIVAKSPALSADSKLDPPGAGSWTRAFAMDLVERPLGRGVAHGTTRGQWHVIAASDDPLGGALDEALARDMRGGVALSVTAPPGVDDLRRMLGAARAVLGGGHPRRLVVAQSGGGGGGFARSLHLEAPDVATCVVDVPAEERAATWVAAEASAHASGFVEARYDHAGVRREPVLRHLALPPAPETRGLDERDVLLMAGGAKGIATECALALLRGTNAAVACIGRSDPSGDPVLATALDRLRGDGRRVRYFRADVTDARAVAAAVAAAETSLGPVTAVMHAAGRNEPTLLSDLDEERLLSTVTPKTQGLRNVLDALARSPLRILVTFGSIIARSGMHGDGHYAVANEWQTLITERFAAAHPECACLAFESSVWSSVGMGERLGSVEALAAAGVDAIAPDDGAALLARLVATARRPTAIVVAGRVGRMPTLERERADLPLRRFLERPRVTYPGIEIVADADVSLDVDPYLREHVIDGEPLVPGVMGLEAMAQVVMALMETEMPPVFEDVHFERPLVVPERERTTLRVAALVTGDGEGRVVIRSERTGFQVDHYSARWKIGGEPPGPPVDVSPTGDDIGIDPADLYGTMLFHTGRFRRLRRYRALSATRCKAEIDALNPVEWFGRYLPQAIVLGDPGANDAAIHALQACVPHLRVVPVASQLLWFAPDAGAGIRHVHAIERGRTDNRFTFDVVVKNDGGRTVAKWTGLQLQAVGAWMPAGAWPGPLLATYLERNLHHGVRVALIDSDGAARRQRSDLAIRLAVGEPVAVWRTADGRPRTDSELEVSTAHVTGMTLAVAGSGAVACDMEPAVARPRDAWRDLLGSAGVSLSETIAADRDEDLTIAATRVWAARECLEKTGAPRDAPLTMAHAAGDGWLTLSNGARPIETFVGRIAGIDDPVAVAVMTRGSDANV